MCFLNIMNWMGSNECRESLAVISSKISSLCWPSSGVEADPAGRPGEFDRETEHPLPAPGPELDIDRHLLALDLRVGEDAVQVDVDPLALAGPLAPEQTAGGSTQHAAIA